MRRQILTILTAVALTSSLFMGAATASARNSVPLPPPPPVQIDFEPYAPPNCEWVQTGNGPLYATSLECELPPQCELIVTEGMGGLQVHSIECDLEPGCYLATGEWNGVLYWYIECLESECIGGCDTTVPDGIGFIGRS